MEIKTVSRDAYHMWKDNEVTRRFMAEMASNLRETEAERIFGATDSAIIKAAHARNEALTIFESILGWKPQELEIDNNQEESK